MKNRKVYIQFSVFCLIIVIIHLIGGIEGRPQEQPKTIPLPYRDNSINEHPLCHHNRKGLVAAGSVKTAESLYAMFSEKEKYWEAAYYWGCVAKIIGSKKISQENLTHLRSKILKTDFSYIKSKEARENLQKFLKEKEYEAISTIFVFPLEYPEGVLFWQLMAKSESNDFKDEYMWGIMTREEMKTLEQNIFGISYESFNKFINQFLGPDEKKKKKQLKEERDPFKGIDFDD